MKNYITIVAIVLVSLVSNIAMAQNETAPEWSFGNTMSTYGRIGNGGHHIKSNKDGSQYERSLFGLKVLGGVGTSFDGISGKIGAELETRWVSLGVDFDYSQLKFGINGAEPKGNSLGIAAYVGIDPIKIINPRAKFGLLLKGGIKNDRYDFTEVVSHEGFYNAEGQEVTIGTGIKHEGAPTDIFFGARAHVRVAKNVEVYGDISYVSHDIKNVHFDQNGSKVDNSFTKNITNVTVGVSYRFDIGKLF